jgi:hypothetical protein
VGGDEVRMARAAQAALEDGLEGGARDRAGGVHQARRAALEDHVVVDRLGAQGPRVAERVAVARALGGGDQRQLARGVVDVAAGRFTAGLDRRLALVQRDERDRELVDAVRAHQTGDLRIREAREQARARSECQDLRERRPRVPVDVAEAAFGVAPGRAPRHAGDDQRGRPAARGRRDRDQRVRLRVIPAHAFAVGDVQLEREAPTGRARGAEEVLRATFALGRADDAGREEEHAAEALQLARQRHPRKVVVLVRIRPGGQVVGDEVLQHERVIGRRRREVVAGAVGRERVVEPRSVSRRHAGIVAHGVPSCRP